LYFVATRSEKEENLSNPRVEPFMSPRLFDRGQAASPGGEQLRQPLAVYLLSF